MWTTTGSGTSTSTTCTTTMPHIAIAGEVYSINDHYHGQMPKYDIEEFLKLEDKELQKYLYSYGYVNTEKSYKKKVMNEEKVGYYIIDERVRQNLQGVYYKKSNVKEWIVYNKKEKKCSISSGVSNIFDWMVKDLVRYSAVYRDFFMKPTKTMCKYILTGKIGSLRDLLQYHITYTYKKKSLTPEVLYDWMLENKQSYINVLEDPENVPRDMISKVGELIPSNMCYNRALKIKASQLENAGGMYDQWSKEQSKKLNQLRGYRDEEIRTVDVQDSDY